MGVLAVAVGGTYLAARAVLASDVVRSSLEQQLARRLGQPVRIGSASAAIFPRVAVDLRDVFVGDPAAVHLGTVRVVTGLRGLISRTITDAEVAVTDSRITLPLPFALSSPDPAEGAAAAAPGLRVINVRVITLRDIVLDVGGRSWTVDGESSLSGDQLEIARLEARAATTRIEASGTMSSLAALEGTFDARAPALELDELLDSAAAFANPSPLDAAARSRTRPEAAREVPMHLTVKLEAAAGRFAATAFQNLSAAIHVVPGHVALVPLSVSAFGGVFDGRLDVATLGDEPDLRLSGRVERVDVVELMKASGAAGGITGRLGGTVALSGRGSDTAALLGSARGTIDAALTDGSMPRLDLVRAIVLAFGKPSGAPSEGSGSAFSRLGGAFALANGTITSDNVAMTSRDFDAAGRGSLRIQTGAVSARVDVVLSEELTAQAGTDLRRYAQENGRVVVPATIGGTLQQPSISLDVASATRRALTNELKRRATSFLDGLFRKNKR